MDVLILGTIHLGDTSDLYSLQQDDITTFNEAHFEQLTDDLASFQAEQIFLEFPAHLQHELNELYSAPHCPQDFQKNEIYQIGFRLAKKLRHPMVYAADWNEELDDSSDLALLAKGPSKDAFADISARVSTSFEQLSAIVQKQTIIDLYKHLNSDEYILQDHLVYADLMLLDDERAFDWVAKYWYYRNLRIVKAIKRSIKPDTRRIIIVFGAAHHYLMKQQLQDDPTFTVMSYSNWTRL